MRRFSKLLRTSISTKSPHSITPISQIRNLSIIPPRDDDKDDHKNNSFSSHQNRSLLNIIVYSPLYRKLFFDIQQLNDQATNSGNMPYLMMGNKLMGSIYSFINSRILNDEDHYQNKVRMQDGSELNLVIKTSTINDVKEDDSLLIGSAILAINEKNELAGIAFIEYQDGLKKGFLHILIGETIEINKIMLRDFANYHHHIFPINNPKNENDNNNNNNNNFSIAISPFSMKAFKDATNIDVSSVRFIPYIDISNAISCEMNLQEDEKDLMKILKEDEKENKNNKYKKNKNLSKETSNKNKRHFSTSINKEEDGGFYKKSKEQVSDALFREPQRIINNLTSTYENLEEAEKTFVGNNGAGFYHLKAKMLDGGQKDIYIKTKMCQELEQNPKNDVISSSLIIVDKEGGKIDARGAIRHNIDKKSNHLAILCPSKSYGYGDERTEVIALMLCAFGKYFNNEIVAEFIEKSFGSNPLNWRTRKSCIGGYDDSLSKMDRNIFNQGQDQEDQDPIQSLFIGRLEEKCRKAEEYLIKQQLPNKLDAAPIDEDIYHSSKLR